MPAIGIGTGVDFGTPLGWGTYWTNAPYFSLPETGINLISGETYTIYGDELISVAISNNLTVEYTCDIGTQSGTKDLVLDPQIGEEGDHPCTIVFKNGGYTFLTEIITFKVIPEVPLGTMNVLMIGDSTMPANLTGAIIDSILGNATLTYVGTKGTTYKNEGNTGFTWDLYNTNVLSPFVKAAVLDVPAYFTDNAIATPEIVYIRLGINDNFSGLTSIATIIASAKTFIDAMLAFDADLKIIISLTTTSENTGAGWDANYGPSVPPHTEQNEYNARIHNYQISLVTEFANGTYDVRVDCGYDVNGLDRDTGYPKIGGVHTNGVHPAGGVGLGYEQLQVVMAADFNKIIHESLKPTGLTLTLISGGVQIDWASNVANETEVWGKSDDGAYALIETVTAGTYTYDDILNAVDLRYYKLRAKNGAYYSDYTEEVSEAMLGPEKVTNGDFAAWTGNTPNGWTLIGEDGTHYLQDVSSKCQIVNATNTNFRMYQSINTPGETYRVKGVGTGWTIGGGYIGLNGSTEKAFDMNANGNYEGYVTCDSAIFMVYFQNLNTGFTIDDISCKKVLLP